MKRRDLILGTAVAAAAMLGLLAWTSSGRSKKSDNDDDFDHATPVRGSSSVHVHAASDESRPAATQPPVNNRNHASTERRYDAVPQRQAKEVTSPDPNRPPAAYDLDAEDEAEVSRTSLSMRPAGSTARDDAVALALEASGADTMLDDPEVLDLTREAYVNAIQMDADCALAWYKLGTLSEPASFPFSILSDPTAEPADVTVAKAAGKTTTRIAPLECTRMAVCIVEQAKDAATREELQQGWTLADGYFNLGIDLRQRVTEPHTNLKKSTVTVAGDELAWLACLVRAVSLDLQDSAKWMEVAESIDDDDGTDGTNPRTVTVAGESLSARTMYQRVATGRLEPRDWDVKDLSLVEPESRALAWQSLGVSLQALATTAATVSVRHSDVPQLDLRGAMRSQAVFEGLRKFQWPQGGVPGEALGEWTARECLQAALATTPANGSVWVDLAKLLIDRTGDAAVIDEDAEQADLSPLDCISAAIDLDPNEPDVWALLASCIEAGMARSRLNLEVLSRPLHTWKPLDCFVEAVQRVPDHPEAWFNLALVAPSGGVSLTLKGTRTGFSEAQLLAQALSLEPRWPRAWARLGHALVMQGQVNVSAARVSISGDDIDAKSAFSRALELNADIAQAWAGLAHVLGENGTVVIRGKEYNRVACAEMRDSIEPVADDATSAP